MFSITMGIVSFFLTSIYSIQFRDADGQIVRMEQFKSKKIMLVNIATGSRYVSQLEGLRQLQEDYKDHLAVIVFPSNSFANEQRDDAGIKEYCRSNYNSNFIIAGKAPVSGTGLQPIYNWLAKSSSNGEMDLIISGDFQKALIHEDGSIQGVFSPKVEPLHPDIIKAITTNY